MQNYWRASDSLPASSGVFRRRAGRPKTLMSCFRACPGVWNPSWSRSTDLSRLRSGLRALQKRRSKHGIIAIAGSFPLLGRRDGPSNSISRTVLPPAIPAERINLVPVMKPTNPTLPRISDALRSPALEPFTCVTMAQRAIRQGRPMEDVLAILRVDADKIRPLHPRLYSMLTNAPR